MSDLNRIKGLILSMMKTTPEMKKAITKVINAIDSDLDVQGYAPGSDVDLALYELDQALIEYDENINNPKQDDSDIIVNKTKRKPFSVDDDDESQE